MSNHMAKSVVPVDRWAAGAQPFFTVACWRRDDERGRVVQWSAPQIQPEIRVDVAQPALEHRVPGILRVIHKIDRYSGVDTKMAVELKGEIGVRLHDLTERTGTALESLVDRPGVCGLVFLLAANRNAE